MDCEIIRDLLPLYADGLTSEMNRRRIEEHIRACPECRRLRDEMCAPMEPEPEDEAEKIAKAIRAARRKQQIKTIMPCVVVLLVCVIGVWLFMEAQFSGELIYAASTDGEKILKEMPALALTDEELALAASILEIPEVRDFLSSGEESITLASETFAPYLDAILSEDARVFEVFILGSHIYISIIDGKQYTCLTYSDIDRTGHIDQISKTIAISPLDEIGEDGNLGDVEVVYELVHAVGTSLTQCQKLKSRHMWFSFLDMP